MANKRPPNRTETLPSGIEVAYWDSIGVDGENQKRRYKIGGTDGEQVPSISTIAGAFDKPALMPAAVKLQEQAVIDLAASGVDIGSLTQEQLRAKLWEAGLHYDAVWKLARKRGDMAHDMLLPLVRDGAVPNLADYDDDLRPWLAAGMKFVRDLKPRPIATEYMVASIEHGFAGRGDLCCEISSSMVRVDYKTVTEWKYDGDKLRPPYDESLIALAGYEIASVESGYLESNERWVVRLGPDGEYDIARSYATDKVFLAALTAYKQKKYLSKGPPAEVAA
jgi:hypothetical protein